MTSKKARTTHTAQDVLCWFLAWTDEEEKPGWQAITANSAHTLLYLSQLHALESLGHPLFSNDIIASKHGPLVDGLDTDTVLRDPADYRFGTAHLVLQEDFDFDDFTFLENQLLIRIWELYAYDHPAGLEQVVQKLPEWITSVYAADTVTGVVPMAVPTVPRKKKS